jgi:hypothetical protein
MTFDSRIGPSGREDDLTNALRAMYAPPSDERYWSDLAQRIMARISNEDEIDTWWQPFARLARVGVLAAGVALTIASIALTREQASASIPSLAYDTVADTPRTSLLQIAIEPDVNAEREATLRYVMAP